MLAADLELLRPAAQRGADMEREKAVLLQRTAALERENAALAAKLTDAELAAKASKKAAEEARKVRVPLMTG